MITTRDFEIVEFLRDYKIASTDTINYFFFPSLSACHKRLKVLYDNKQVKRTRDFVNNQYLYFIKKPKNIKHSLHTTEQYRELSKTYDIRTFKLEPALGTIRPDAIFGYVENGKNKIGLLEIELSKKGFNMAKYERFVKTQEYLNYNLVKFDLFLYDAKEMKKINLF